MTTKFKIEKGVEIPASKGGRPKGQSKYPFAGMAIGDSFECDVKQSTIWAIANHYANQNGVKFTTRKTENGVRVWRIT